MTDIQTIGGKIAFYRIRAGFTQQEIADKLGVSRSLVGQIEKDLTKPNLEFLSGFVKLTEINYQSLLDNEPIQTIPQMGDYKTVFTLEELRKEAERLAKGSDKNVTQTLSAEERAKLSYFIGEGGRKEDPIKGSNRLAKIASDFGNFIFFSLRGLRSNTRSNLQPVGRSIDRCKKS
ncbi:MAG: helix-turn-helix transcriptional regulator [Cyclobacteriaceae bacterium]|nr:helix-turn-helix transcriptional regulator [Cyclobacteriaceae bacterium]